MTSTARPPFGHWIPDAVTETIRADQLTARRTILVPMTEDMETVTHVAIDCGRVTVHTDGTGPDSAYQWRADDGVDVVCAEPVRRQP